MSRGVSPNPVYFQELPLINGAYARHGLQHDEAARRTVEFERTT
jgi:hypothetical protein